MAAFSTDETTSEDRNVCHPYCHPVTEEYKDTKFCPYLQHCCYGEHGSRNCCANETLAVPEHINKKVDELLVCPADVLYKRCNPYCKQGRKINGFDCKWFCCGYGMFKYCCDDRDNINQQNIHYNTDACEEDKGVGIQSWLYIAPGISSFVVILLCVCVLTIKRRHMLTEQALNREESNSEPEETAPPYSYANLFAPGGVYGPQSDDVPDWLPGAPPDYATAISCKITTPMRYSPADASEPSPPSYGEVVTPQPLPDIVNDSSQFPLPPPSSESMNSEAQRDSHQGEVVAEQ
ncbi:uncharacterized protein LOC141899441 isoform X2 [Tubulanus polymorphus]|uniref:uncharacterized protein LOC141899441 isoform X2 n=1 Tax=Tubulanus polymorphus TaxID=672921 RepID=UPI003DA5255E